MADKVLSEEDLQTIYRLSKRWGQEVAQQAFGDEGPGPDVDLSAMEDVAVAAARGLTDGAVETLLFRQADCLAEPQPCPCCGQLCTTKMEEKSRELLIRGGTPKMNEIRCHCSTCRRDFFPSTHLAAN